MKPKLDTSPKQKFLPTTTEKLSKVDTSNQ